MGTTFSAPPSQVAPALSTTVSSLGDPPPTPLPPSAASSFHTHTPTSPARSDLHGTSGLIIIVDTTSLNAHLRAHSFQRIPHLNYHRLHHLIATTSFTTSPRHILSSYALTTTQLDTSAFTHVLYTSPHDDCAQIPQTIVRLIAQHTEGAFLLGTTSRRTIVLVTPTSELTDSIKHARLAGCAVEVWTWALVFSPTPDDLSVGENIGPFSRYALGMHWHFLSETLIRETPSSSLLQGCGSDEDYNDGCAHGSQYATPSSRQNVILSTRENTESTILPTWDDSPSLQFARQALDTANTTIRSDVVRDGPRLREASPESRGCLSQRRCKRREFCTIRSCTRVHTAVERRYFTTSGRKTRLAVGKQVKCMGGVRCDRNKKKNGVCSFLHEGERPFCVACLGRHFGIPCDAEREEVVGEEMISQLVADGCLVPK